MSVVKVMHERNSKQRFVALLRGKGLTRCYEFFQRRGLPAPLFAPWLLQKPTRQSDTDIIFIETDRNSTRAGPITRTRRGSPERFQTRIHIKDRMVRIILSQTKYGRLRVRLAESNAKEDTSKHFKAKADGMDAIRPAE